MRKVTVSAVCLSLCLSLAACGGGDSGTIETEDGEVTYDVDNNDGDFNATVTGEDGQQMTIESGPNASVDLPDGFSIYPGASVISSTNVSTGEGSGSMLMIQSDDGPEEVAAFYRNQAEKAGIDIKMEMKANDSQIISGESADGLVFSINSSQADGGGSTSQVTIGSKM